MGLPCLKLHPYCSCLTSNILPNQLACPSSIKVRLDLRVALRHDLAKRTVAGLRLVFLNGNTESCTWITHQILDVTTPWSTGHIKDLIFPEEPERNNAREPRRIKRGQMCWNGQSRQIGYFLWSEFANRSQGIVCCHASSSPFMIWYSMLFMDVVIVVDL